MLLANIGNTASKEWGREFKEGLSDGNESCFKDKHISLDLSLFFCFFTPSWNAESEVNLKH